MELLHVAEPAVVADTAPVVYGGPDSAHDLRRRQILEAAQACFARTGFHGTSTHEICAEARISPGGLYRYFRSKEQMIAAIADDERVRNAAMVARLGAEGAFCDRMVRVGLDFLSEMSNPSSAALMAEVCAEGLRNATVGDRFRRNETECRCLIEMFVDAAVARGEIERPDDIGAAVSVLMAVGEGLVMRMAYDPKLTVDRVEPMLRLVTEGLFKTRDASVRA